MARHMCRCQKRTCGNWFSLSTLRSLRDAKYHQKHVRPVEEKLDLQLSSIASQDNREIKIVPSSCVCLFKIFVGGWA